jgi:hypothetical protein
MESEGYSDIAKYLRALLHNSEKVYTIMPLALAKNELYINTLF